MPKKYEELFDRAAWMSRIIDLAAEGNEDAIDRLKVFIIKSGEMLAELGDKRDLVAIARHYYQIHKTHIEAETGALCSPPNEPRGL